MANIRSQIKRNRQNERRRVANQSMRSSLKTAAKKARLAAAENDLEAAGSLMREAARALDKAASKGALHKRTAARRKSRLTRTVTKAEATGEG